MQKWLDNVIVEGLQMLLVMRLPNAPANDTINAVADVWLNAFEHASIAWHEQTDADRIRKAFSLCSANIESWPAPKTVLNYLPAPREPLRLSHKKTSPMPENIKQELQQLQQKLRMPYL